MYRMRLIVVAILLALCSAIDIAGADEAANAWSVLREGGTSP
jgi:hypothetical protein